MEIDFKALANKYVSEETMKQFETIKSVVNVMLENMRLEIKDDIKEEIEKQLKRVEINKERVEEKASISLGYERDNIFLLSSKEYEKWERYIPNIGEVSWYLRDHLDYFYASSEPNITNVNYVWSNNNINRVFHDGLVCGVRGIRPAIRLNVIGNGHIHEDYEPGNRILVYNFPWIYLGDGIAIAEVPIAFDMFDAQNNQYSISKVRDFLNHWLNVRKF